VPRPRLMRRPRRVIFKLDEADFRRLQEAARARRVPVSELIRSAVRQLIEGDPPPAHEGPGGGDPAVTVGFTRPVTAEELHRLIDRYIYDEISKAKARAILNGVIELKGALQGRAGRPERLRARLRELREQYRELAREVRAQSVLRPLGEELVVMGEELGVPLFEARGRRR